ncbi:MAG: hypothetical protein JSR45_08735 [Proteobacteria bacterium]|nr:hypothetical protein [Pseudomonadota bacterium]
MRAIVIALAGIGMLLDGAAQAAPSPTRQAARPAVRAAPRHPPRKPLMEQARGRGLVTAVISEREVLAAEHGPQL